MSQEIHNLILDILENHTEIIKLFQAKFVALNSRLEKLEKRTHNIEKLTE